MSTQTTLDTQLVVIGAGPGGYTAAFRAADLGLNTMLVERYPSLGGVCLNVGCIPSKALLHATGIADEVSALGELGIWEPSARPQINLDGLRTWKDGVVKRLGGGIQQLAKQRKVTVLTGAARFVSRNELEIVGETTQRLRFKHAVVAAGSSAATIPNLPDDPRIIDSTGALALTDVPKRMLVIGGGIIGLEMATVYHALGSAITVVEMLDSLVPGCDADLVRPLQQRLRKTYEGIYLSTRVREVRPTPEGLEVFFEGDKAPASAVYDKVLVAVGRRPNGHKLNLAAAGVAVNEAGYVPVDRFQRTNIDHIYAVGDITSQPMLAHKAAAEGRVAAEVIAGQRSALDALVIPSVAYTTPEIAWVGLSETAAKSKDMDIRVGKFPFVASGRALTMGNTDGFTKIVIDNATQRIVGAGIVGSHAGELIAELALAIELGADAEDVALTIHPHPSLSESVALAAAVLEGTITDLYLPRRK
ncbi:MAG: dihydrolipoyl dehydrogenase [Proteobacteria bacterium]|nr:dihydrolipoyl dehydrogenase [Pseudomonadota bacterium]